MIKQFKQHFVPFTITSRKILTVFISILFYHHKTNFIQMLGIFIVLSAVSTEFLMEISKPAPNNNEEMHLNEEKEANQPQVQPERIESDAEMQTR